MAARLVVMEEMRGGKGNTEEGSETEVRADHSAEVRLRMALLEAQVDATKALKELRDALASRAAVEASLMDAEMEARRMENKLTKARHFILLGSGEWAVSEKLASLLREEARVKLVAGIRRARADSAGARRGQRPQWPRRGKGVGVSPSTKTQQSELPRTTAKTQTA